MDNPNSMTPAPLASKLQTLLSHLTKCDKIPVSDRKHAQHLKNLRYPPKSNQENHSPLTLAAPPALFHAPAVPFRPPLLAAATHPIPIASPTPTRSLTRSYSETDMALVSTDSRPVQRLRVGALDSDASETFSYSLTREFHGDVEKLLITGNVAFRAVEQPFWKYFFAKYVPGAPLPTRQAVASRILDQEATAVVDGMRRFTRGRYRTGQSDGWKTISRASIIGSMVNVEYQVCFVLCL